MLQDGFPESLPSGHVVEEVELSRGAAVAVGCLGLVELRAHHAVVLVGQLLKYQRLYERTLLSAVAAQHPHYVLFL